MLDFRRRQKISIHALRGEGDPDKLRAGQTPARFQSTPSVGRATVRRPFRRAWYKLFQSTPSVGRATKEVGKAETTLTNFNPRPPWGGRRYPARFTSLGTLISIHALRGEGDLDYLHCINRENISIHALRGEGDLDRESAPNQYKRISIHALRGEGDINLP